MLNNKDSEKEVNALLTTEQVVFDPIQAKGYQQFQVLGLTLDSLVKKDLKQGLVSGIAQRWQVSADQKEYTFFIDERARFHNGDSIYSKDIKISFERHLEKGSPSLIASYLRKILKKIEIVDESTVTFALRGPYPPFLELLSLSGFGIVSHKSMPQNIIGSGPYRYDSMKVKAWCFKRFESYPFKITNVDKYCFSIERGVEETLRALNSGIANLSVGAPVEVALSKTLNEDFISRPTFSAVATHAYLNHNRSHLREKAHRRHIFKIIKKVRDEIDIFTKFDRPLETFFPKGIMPENYYRRRDDVESPTVAVPKGQVLKLVFPYGIFLEKTVHRIVKAFEHEGYNIDFINVKGKELLEPILSGDFDIVFVPYQGVMPDPDGYLDLLDPDSILAKAGIPSAPLFQELSKIRFLKDEGLRLSGYAKAMERFEEENYVIHFSQNGIPIVYRNSIKPPNLGHSYQLNLRELEFSE